MKAHDVIMHLVKIRPVVGGKIGEPGIEVKRYTGIDEVHIVVAYLFQYGSGAMLSLHGFHKFLVTQLGKHITIGGGVVVEVSVMISSM